MIEFDPPETIYGVDFSAAKSDAGRNTWIAEGRGSDDRLVVEHLSDASGRLDCDPGRDSTLPALLDGIFAAEEEPKAIGFDVPFGLPAGLLGDANWREFLQDVADRWGVLDEVGDPVSLYVAARELAEQDDVSLLRATDDERGGQEPTGYRIKTQTYYGISALLAELPDDVSVLPMDEPMTDTLVLETYPAASFRRLRDCIDSGAVHDTGYKRDTRRSIERRIANVRALSDAGVDFHGHCEFAIASDHALDAVAAAYAAWRATREGTLPDEVLDDDGEVASPYDVEGYIFA